MATLVDDINEYKSSFNKKASLEKQKLYAQAIKELEASGVAQGLKTGDHAPNFTLPDATGKIVSLSETLTKSPVILTFYRGGWCPYCNLELRAYQRALPEIREAGAKLIAVSPQTPDASLTTKKKDELEFTVLSDVGGKVAHHYDLVFKLQDYLIDLYKQSGLDVPAHNGNNTWELPKPATFVIDQHGTIVFAHVDSDYRNRTEPSEVIKIVKGL
ncbi:peroxiredoxin-like family protein [Sporolactobacillus laevolacticus]|uniref:thioredoxin-dependent peroxiredoxin n=1 Tax=Sporolactobacillus laevolacticus DSM 442 TaxID=1395513 RepID=V6J9Z0_9BACL|nr:peroxiredoxin-like family protein [Sporolactobacillus laevolacticus]EST13599.1 alkyl hydroperoxide reductase [Sporolactobacillus laevolacticus DSM 442]